MGKFQNNTFFFFFFSPPTAFLPYAIFFLHLAVTIKQTQGTFSSSPCIYFGQLGWHLNYRAQLWVRAGTRPSAHRCLRFPTCKMGTNAFWSGRRIYSCSPALCRAQRGTGLFRLVSKTKEEMYKYVLSWQSFSGISGDVRPCLVVFNKQGIRSVRSRLTGSTSSERRHYGLPGTFKRGFSVYFQYFFPSRVHASTRDHPDSGGG